LDQAGAGETPVQRLRLFVRGYVALARDVALGRRDPLAVFNDVRALDDPVVNRAYVAMFKRARALIAPPQGRGEARGAVNAATHLLLSQIFWSVIWLPLCDAEDYDRAATRMLDILENGLVAVDALWLPPGAAPAGASGVSEDVSRETFLRAATRIINEHGYLGASVDRISAHLKVTKGSFYHHNEAKDDLVVACFRRTLDVMRRAQRSAIDSCESGGGQLATASLSLVHLQVSDETPLLRTSALTSAPEAMQSALLAQFERISLTFSAMISDGIQDGSVRPVDAHIGAEMVTAMINAAAELQHWTPKMTSEARTQAYAGAMLHGLAPLVGSRGG
jgi:AcrR family transcriptional regulator